MTIGSGCMIGFMGRLMVGLKVDSWFGCTDGLHGSIDGWIGGLVAWLGITVGLMV